MSERALIHTERHARLLTRDFVVELSGYALASAAALAVDMMALRWLVQHVGWHYLPASAVAFVAGAGVAYLLCARFVFRTRRFQSRTLEFSSFVALGVVGLLINAAALSVSISAVGLGLITAKLIAAICTFATNFTLRRMLLFSGRTA
jgi:putative flippase GtrA